jgi:hypothetical protein
MSRQPTTRVDTTQPNLFDPDTTWDEPVPFTLTPRGRRLVDPAAPNLRVVGSDDAPDDDGRDDDGRVDDGRVDDGRVDDARVDRELRGLDGPDHARVRALQRAGTPADDIAGRVDLDPLTLAVFRAADPAVAPVPGPSSGSPTGPVALDTRTVGSSALRSRRAVPVSPDRHVGGRGTSGHRHGADREVMALSVLATVGEVDTAGLVVTTNRIAVAALVVAWARDDRNIRAAAMRVVLRVADAATADLVARAWADRLGLGRDRVTTVPWRAAPGPRDVQAVVRVTDRRLAADVATALARWPG